MNTSQQEVWQFIQSLNQCWTTNNPKDLEKLDMYFHESMVAITPTDTYRREGKENCLAGWKGFAQNTKIHFWKETDPKIDIYNDRNCAVVSYYFDISFDMNGHTIDMKGRDMFTLIKENNQWKVVADQFSPFPQI